MQDLIVEKYCANLDCSLEPYRIDALGENPSSGITILGLILLFVYLGGWLCFKAKQKLKYA